MVETNNLEFELKYDIHYKIQIKNLAYEIERNKIGCVKFIEYQSTKTESDSLCFLSRSLRRIIHERETWFSLCPQLIVLCLGKRYIWMNAQARLPLCHVV